MVLMAEVNGKKYNMILVSSFEKQDNNKIKFRITNGNISMEEFASDSDRNTTYNNLMSEFVKQC
jgi:hypothetical protein